jgi:hypothetical protein
MEETGMAYDQTLANRIRECLANQPGITEKKMFGGIGYLLNGNMACGVNKEYLIVRVEPVHYQGALDEPFTKVFDITGRPMSGWVMVSPDGYISDDGLKSWVQRGIVFASTLPAK